MASVREYKFLYNFTRNNSKTNFLTKSNQLTRLYQLL